MRVIGWRVDVDGEASAECGGAGELSRVWMDIAAALLVDEVGILILPPRVRT